LTITLDINVALDVFQKREPHYAASAQVMALVVTGAVRGVFPAHALTTLYYLVRKHGARSDAEAAMDQLLRHFEVGNLDSADWRAVRGMNFADFEDAVVAKVAERTNSAYIVTRNVGDFTDSPRPAITPTDFLTLSAARLSGEE
jgi:predicted nucleic acid-binding protein